MSLNNTIKNWDWIEEVGAKRKLRNYENCTSRTYNNVYNISLCFIRRKIKDVFDYRTKNIEVLGTTVNKNTKVNRIRYKYYLVKNEKGKTLILDANIKFTFKNKILMAKVISVNEMTELPDHR